MSTNGPARANAAGDVTAELSLLHSRALIMRAVWEAGLNVHVTPRGHGLPRVSVVRAELPQTTEEPQRFRLRFSTDGTYELWSARGRLGAGSLDAPFDTEQVRLVVHPGGDRLPEPGSDYEVVVNPLDDMFEHARQGLRMTIQTDAETEDEARTVELEFVDDVPERAAAFLRQLVLAYVEQRHGWTAPTHGDGSGLALLPSATSNAPARDAFRVADYGRAASPSSFHDPALEDLEVRPSRISMLHLCLGAIAMALIAAAITRAGSSDPEPEPEDEVETSTLDPGDPAVPPPSALSAQPSTPAATAAPPQPDPAAEAHPTPPVSPLMETPPGPASARGTEREEGTQRTAPAEAEAVPPPQPAAYLDSRAEPRTSTEESPMRSAEDATKAVPAQVPQRVVRPKPAPVTREPALATPPPSEELPIQREPRSTRFRAGPYDLPNNPY